MVGQHIGPTSDGLDHRNICRFSKFCQLPDSLRILHPTPSNDCRPFSQFKRCNGIGQFAGIRHLLANAMQFWLEKRQGIIIGPSLHILWQSNERRAAISRIQQGGQGRRQRLYNLRWMGYPIPITTNRLETIINSKSWITKMLQLLQHRIRKSGQKRVAAEHQHGQSIGMAKRRGRQQICSARTRGCGAEHKFLPQVVFSIRRRRKAHSLLVLPTIERQYISVIIKRLAQTRHIAMSKNTKATTTDAGLEAINFNILCRQIADDGLSRCKANGCVCCSHRENSNMNVMNAAFLRFRLP